MVDVEEKQIKNSEGNLKFIHATKDDDIYRIGYCLPIDTLYKLNNTEFCYKEKHKERFSLYLVTQTKQTISNVVSKINVSDYPYYV